MSIRRQKVAVDSDPLSLFLSQGSNNNDNEEEEEEYNNEVEIKKQKEEEIKNEKLKSKTLVNTLAPGRDIDVIPTKEVKEVKEKVHVNVVEERKEIKSTPIQSQVQSQVKQQEESETTKPAPIQATPASVPVVKKQEVKATPQGPTSVFETGEDIFLKKSTPTSTLDDELFGSKNGELSELKSISSSSKGKVAIQGEDSDQEDKYDDLAVGQILEREELDFETFGRSKVRQYEPKPVTKPNPTIYQDDFILQDEDDLNEMESILSGKKSSGYETKTKYNPSKTKSTSISTIDVDSLDINAYISQQENSGGGLFD
eukprot:CAMPEP_0174819294 /NCGR_PEP_ID=MMETSP1107-20130205/2432_1 /TAXON_ID=36770 /ORGANISM="Paraphysomonas vestita, Strain GFlagA" /LENGTH=313 /DNA_ID=CAMNT_0016032497 /DNA_START=29 /DNA_END=970 /DNA_ORIENTATION=-